MRYDAELHGGAVPMKVVRGCRTVRVLSPLELRPGDMLMVREVRMVSSYEESREHAVDVQEAGV